MRYDPNLDAPKLDRYLSLLARQNVRYGKPQTENCLCQFVAKTMFLVVETCSSDQCLSSAIAHHKPKKILPDHSSFPPNSPRELTQSHISQHRAQQVNETWKTPHLKLAGVSSLSTQGSRMKRTTDTKSAA